MRNLEISAEVFESMLACALRHRPVEACALLGGKDGKVTSFIEMTNADNAEDHFSLVPKEQFAAVKRFREQGIEMLGIWHSHPASPARMSEEDMKLAYTPDTAYMILSLQNENEPVLKAFSVNGGVVDEIRLKIAGNNNEQG